MSYLFQANEVLFPIEILNGVFENAFFEVYNIREKNENKTGILYWMYADGINNSEKIKKYADGQKEFFNIIKLDLDNLKRAGFIVRHPAGYKPLFDELQWPPNSYNVFSVATPDIIRHISGIAKKLKFYHSSGRYCTFLDHNCILIKDDDYILPPPNLIQFLKIDKGNIRSSLRNHDDFEAYALAPELLKDSTLNIENVTDKSDIWSLGLLAAIMFEGKLPFVNISSEYEYIGAVTTNNIQLNLSRTPEEYREIIKLSLDINPQVRPDLDDFIDAFLNPSSAFDNPDKRSGSAFNRNSTNRLTSNISLQSGEKREIVLSERENITAGATTVIHITAEAHGRAHDEMTVEILPVPIVRIKKAEFVIDENSRYFNANITIQLLKSRISLYHAALTIEGIDSEFEYIATEDDQNHVAPDIFQLCFTGNAELLDENKVYEIAVDLGIQWFDGRIRAEFERVKVKNKCELSIIGCDELWELNKGLTQQRTIKLGIVGRGIVKIDNIHFANFTPTSLITCSNQDELVKTCYENDAQGTTTIDVTCEIVADQVLFSQGSIVIKWKNIYEDRSWSEQRTIPQNISIIIKEPILVKYGLAIDFGTSNTWVASISNDSSETIDKIISRSGEIFHLVEDETDPAVPSMIQYGETDIKIGALAKSLFKGHANNVFFSIKRELRNPLIRKIVLDGKPFNKDSFDIVSDYLRQFFAVLSADTGRLFQEYVFTYPTKWGRSIESTYRDLIRNAGITCEDANLHFIDEASAGAICFVNKNPNYQGYLLVYDYGGGTTDIALLHVKRVRVGRRTYNRMTPIRAFGNERLGGDDISDEIISIVRKSIRKSQNEKLYIPFISHTQPVPSNLSKTEKNIIADNGRELWTTAEEIKRRLSTNIENEGFVFTLYFCDEGDPADPRTWVYNDENKKAFELPLADIQADLYRSDSMREVERWIDKCVKILNTLDDKENTEILLLGKASRLGIIKELFNYHTRSIQPEDWRYKPQLPPAITNKDIQQLITMPDIIDLKGSVALGAAAKLNGMIDFTDDCVIGDIFCDDMLLICAGSLKIDANCGSIPMLEGVFTRDEMKLRPWIFVRRHDVEDDIWKAEVVKIGTVDLANVDLPEECYWGGYVNLRNELIWRIVNANAEDEIIEGIVGTI